MKKAKDFMWENSNILFSYAKLSGKKPIDVLGHIDFDKLTFKVSGILFEDGSVQLVEGEYDFPYMTGESEESTKNIELIEKDESDIGSSL